MARASLLLVHQDALWLDLLVRVFESRGFAVQVASSVPAAQAVLYDGSSGSILAPPASSSGSLPAVTSAGGSGSMPAMGATSPAGGGVVSSAVPVGAHTGPTAATAATAALGLPSSIGPIDVVVASWDTHHLIGGAVYRWALVHRFDLRDRFVFLADEVTGDFDAVVGGRCLLVPTAALAELIQVVEATARRLRGPAASGGAFAVPGNGPRVLIVDDDPVLLAAMVDVLTGRGYAVTAAAAVAAGDVLARETFDALVVDIAVAGGVAALIGRAGRAGAALVDRCVLVANGPPPIADRPLGRPVFSKGDDAGLLLGALARIAPRRA
ncbi:MAG TPA: hypothetical protein VHE35_00150 [Kofleriaceae bacterium]|nr:hypothetical protein [Kofleriaceae bacterium]